MSNLSQRIANLPPEKLALLQQRLIKKDNTSVAQKCIPRRQTSEPCPLSFSQQRLWFLNQLESNSPFNISIAVKLDGILNLQALQQTLNAIVARHEALRTNFVSVEENPIQIIAEVQTVKITVIDLSELDSEAEVQQILKKETQYSFDFSSDLMLRPTLIRLSEDEHILLLVMHHVASDGWSVGILYKELAGFYQAFSMGNSSPFSELPIQYADFAYWQRQWLSGNVLQRQLNYWKQQLKEAPSILSLPTDKPRPPIQTFQGSTKHFQLNQDLTQKLKNLSQKSGATLFMTLIAAFATLLSRYSGQEDIVIGTPIANRNRSEVESLIGFFINTLVLRNKLQGNPTFLELLEQVRETTLGAYDHQDLPFEKLVEELQPERTLSHTPIYQVMFVLQNAAIGTLELPGLTLTPLELEDATARDDLFLSMMETEAGLSGELVYNTDLFEITTIERMVIHFQTLLESIVTNPKQHIAQLPIIDATEQHKLLVEWNNTGADYPLEQTFSQLFEATVEKNPDSIAVVFENVQTRHVTSLTYQQLNARANRWARHLIELGVKAETIVALNSERNIDFLTAILAVFKAGAAYLPLNPHHPAERNNQILQQSQVPLVLSSSSSSSSSSCGAGIPARHESRTGKDAHSTNYAHSTSQVLILEELDSLDYSTENLPARSIPENLAYVIYTSGSTGKPKGAMLEQRGMLNHLYAKIDDLQLTQTDIVAQTAAQTFDISIWQFLAALLIGGRVEIIRTEVTADPAKLLELVQSSQISILEIVPSLLRMMLEHIESGTNKPNLSKLRWLLLTGETLPPQLCRQWFEYYPTIPMMNAYGPTECSDDVTHYPIYMAPKQEILNIPIGRPVSNTQLYILDKHLQPVPTGVSGELYVGGVGVGRGYLYNEMTQQVFIDNPFTPGARLYKTGDKARYLFNGNIEFLNRIDYQVKIRGFRIELGEIEAVLAQHPQVQEVVVIAREDKPGNQYLIAYVVSNVLNASELRDFVKQKLPEYMIPAAFVMLETIPLTPNGKVDRRALPTPDVQQSLITNFVPPQTPTQKILAQLWLEILNLKQVGIYDNFFDVGGHSLLATQVVSRLRSLFGMELPLRRLFEAPTIATLADSIDEVRATVQKLQITSSYQQDEREEIEL